MDLEVPVSSAQPRSHSPVELALREAAADPGSGVDSGAPGRVPCGGPRDQVPVSGGRGGGEPDVGLGSVTCTGVALSGLCFALFTSTHFRLCWFPGN